MKTLNVNEISAVSGGEVGATGMGDNYSYTGDLSNPAACANSILFWGATGAGLGSIGSGVFGFFAGAGLGGYFGTTSSACNM